MMIDQDHTEEHIRWLLEHLKLDVKDEAFRETPRRVAKFWHDFLDREPPEIKVFPSRSTDVISLQGYTTWGLCPHHLLPVKYEVSVSYVPRGQVFGISKLPRIVDYMLRTLPLQEDIPHLVNEYIHHLLCVECVTTHVTGMHLCMTMRGIKAKDCTLVTSSTLERKDYECLSIP